MRRILTLALLALAALPAVAQLKVPAPSPKASLAQAIGITDVTITWSRPGVKGRQIFGGLVPYDKVWRTGANEATVMSVSDDVTVDGQKLAKGTYSLHTIPGPDEWTVIFNSVANQWGSYSYDAAKDTLRIKVKPQKAAFTEWLTFEIPTLSTDAGTVVIRWAEVAVPFTVNANTTARVVAAAREAIAAAKPDDTRTPLTAANFAFNNGMLAEAEEWGNASLKAGETMSNLWLKARIQQKRGQIAEAVRTGEQALAKKTDKDSADLAAEIRKQVDSWKK